LALIAAGKAIRYEGVVGAVAFDQYGDIAGPFRLWQIVDGKVTTVGEMTMAGVEAVKAKVRQAGPRFLLRACHVGSDRSLRSGLKGPFGKGL
jgi:hypothetical protein